MNKGEKGLTMREMRQALNIPLFASEFVSRPGACENPKLYLPLVDIPTHLMSSDKAQAAKSALEDCQKIVGGWGERKSKFDSPEFKAAAGRFKAATGVEAKDVFDLLYKRFVSE